MGTFFMLWKQAITHHIIAYHMIQWHIIISHIRSLHTMTNHNKTYQTKYTLWQSITHHNIPCVMTYDSTSHTSTISCCIITFITWHKISHNNIRPHSVVCQNLPDFNKITCHNILCQIIKCHIIMCRDTWHMILYYTMKKHKVTQHMITCCTMITCSNSITCLASPNHKIWNLP